MNKIIDIIKNTITNKIDLALFTVFLALLNMHIITGNSAADLVFYPSALESGRWWTILTHPFIHVTWYHFLLDAGAFMLLYAGLENKKISGRVSYVLACGTGSLCATLLFSPVIEIQGLCGISGIAHGLMAISGLEMMQRKADAKAGFFCLALVVSKCVYEIIHGDVLFAFLQFGLCGSPLVACHAGGVTGGIAAFFVIQWFPSKMDGAQRNSSINYSSPPNLTSPQGHCPAESDNPP